MGSPDTPLVTIIVPMYQAEGTIECALASVAHQTYENWECVVVDDGSTDGGFLLAEHMAESDTRFRVVRQANAGRSVARNVGLSEARGEFVCFLDADDALAPTFLEQTVSFGVRTGADLVITGFQRGNRDAGLVSHFAGESKIVAPADAIAMACAFWDNEKLAPFPSYAAGTVFRSVWGKLLRVPKSLQELPKFERRLRFGEDLLFMLDTYEYCHLIVALDYVGYLYADNPTSTTGRYHDGDVFATVRLLDSLRERAGEGLHDEVILKVAGARDVLSLVALIARSGENNGIVELDAAMGNPALLWACGSLRGHRVSRSIARQFFSECILYMLRHGHARSAVALRRLAQRGG